MKTTELKNHIKDVEVLEAILEELTELGYTEVYLYNNAKGLKLSMGKITVFSKTANDPKWLIQDSDIILYPNSYALIEIEATANLFYQD